MIQLFLRVPYSIPSVGDYNGEHFLHNDFPLDIVHRYSIPLASVEFIENFEFLKGVKMVLIEVRFENN